MFFLPSTKLFSQNKTIDSLTKVLNTAEISDSLKMETMLALGWEYMFFNNDTARKIIYQCIELARKNNNPVKIGAGYAYIGSSFFRSNDFDSALHYYKLAETYFLKDTSEEAKQNVIVNRMSMGTVALQQGHHETAINNYLNVIKQLENTSSNNWNSLVVAYANMGLIYNDLKQYYKALYYHAKALQINQQHPEDKKRMVQIMMFTALDHLNLKNYDSVKQKLDQSEELVNELKSDYFNAIFYGIKGRYYNEIGDYELSINNSKKAIVAAERSSDDFQKANALLQLGISYFKRKNYEQSTPYFEASLSLFKKIRDPLRALHSMDYLSQAYTEAKDYKKAVNYYRSYISLNDSINTNETKKKINEIDNKYQAAKKEASIVQLEKNNALQKVSLQHKSALNVALITGCVLSLLIAGLLYKNYQTKNNLLRQKEALHQQQIKELQKERKIAVMQSVLKGQEAERSRLARDLHDGVGGLLSGLKLSISGMKGNVILSEENAEAFSKVIHQLDQSIVELRRVSHNMMPEALIKFGLTEALQNYCDQLNFSGKIHVLFQSFGMEKRMDQNTEIIVYRIFQELLNNVIRHSEAKNVLVQLTREGNRFSLTVEDDGKGFDTKESHAGTGISNIKARAEYLNGNVDIVSTEEGTSVHVEGDC